MTSAEEYIQNSLEALRLPSESSREATVSIEQEIKRLLLSKKFRKYSARPELVQHIEEAIAMSVRDQAPINLTFLNGAYKLWRLEECPEADWAELFSLIYYTRWLKPICEMYAPGVWLDFYMDDWIVSKLNQVPPSDVSAYIDSFIRLLAFIRPYQPENLRMTLTPVESQFPHTEAFEIELQEKLHALTHNTKPVISEKERGQIELNAMPDESMKSDPLWYEKISLTHALYLKWKREQGYHMRTDKILIFTQPLASGTVLAVGTTKTSVAKFWAGIGALKKRNESYIETILSPEQIKNTQAVWEPLQLDGLNGKNFSRIRIV